MIRLDETRRVFSLSGMDHFTVLTPDAERTRSFYEIFGLTVGPRPPELPAGGFWLYLDGRPILHVVVKADVPIGSSGLLDHMAFRASGLGRAARLLGERGVSYRLRHIAEPFSIWQLFFEDPFGAKVEFDFDGNEPAPEGWTDASPPPGEILTATA
jgi:catechol 2,3-dioxygenase-like lactoylglutathione lyase family enzyme